MSHWCQSLYESHAPQILLYGRALGLSHSEAEDVLQETFLEVCRSLGSWRGDGSLWGWIRTIAASKAMMRYRREKARETDLLDDELDPGSRGVDVPLRMDLESAMSRLTERSRAVVWLHDVEGYTHEEIAELMGMTTSFSKSQLARAHQKLRRWLGEEAT